MPEALVKPFQTQYAATRSSAARLAVYCAIALRLLFLFRRPSQPKKVEEEA